jgi:hypothetical protein
MVQGSTNYSIIRIKHYFASRGISRNEKNKTKIDPAAVGYGINI